MLLQTIQVIQPFPELPLGGCQANRTLLSGGDPAIFRAQQGGNQPRWVGEWLQCLG